MEARLSISRYMVSSACRSRKITMVHNPSGLLLMGSTYMRCDRPMYRATSDPLSRIDTRERR